MGTRERRARSDESDRVLSALFLGALEQLQRGTRVEIAGIALAAVGGYGRGELCPGSDLDILIVHNDSFSEDALKTFVNSVLYPIWDGKTDSADIPRSVDHSVRTLSQTREAANTDLKVAMGLLDIRLIGGDASLVASVQHNAIDEWRRDSKRRLSELKFLLAGRHERAGELAYLLEPDLKEARGGLRDIVALRAIAMSGAIDIPLERVSAAESSLNSIRETLHFQSGRAKDRLLFQEQDKVAAALGYSDADALMGEVAKSARAVDYLLQSTWHRLDHQGKDGLGRFLRRPRITSVGRGIIVAHQEVVVGIGAITMEDPVLGLRAAAKAAQLGLHLSMESCVLLAQSLKAGIGSLPNSLAT
jgi:[protein-PII] uridylyltransferase